MGNNPINFIDLFGLDSWETTDQNPDGFIYQFYPISIEADRWSPNRFDPIAFMFQMVFGERNYAKVMFGKLTVDELMSYSAQTTTRERSGNNQNIEKYSNDLDLNKWKL